MFRTTEKLTGAPLAVIKLFMFLHSQSRVLKREIP